MRSRIRRRALTAVGAVLVTVVGLAPTNPLVGSALAAGKATTTLSIRAALPAVEPGGSDRITGDLAIGQGLSPAGRPVVLEARPSGSDEFVPIAQATSGDRGGVRYTVTPPVTTRYRWRYDGADDARPSVSGVVAVVVKDRTGDPTRTRTTLSIRHVVRVGDDGTVDIVRGTLRAGRTELRNRQVLLLRRPVGQSGWLFGRAQRTGSHGAVAFRVDPGKASDFKLYFLGSRYLTPARSGVVRVQVRPDATIAAGAASVPQGGSTTVSGVVTYLGAPLAGATVRLWAVRVGEPDSGAFVASSTTAADGSVSFTVTPTTTTRYRLRVPPTDTRAGTTSGPVVVGVTAPPAGRAG